MLAEGVFPRDQMDGDFSVGVAEELHADALELSTQCREVLDDAVVDHRNLSGGVPVRMGVAVGGPAMGGPPGVSDPGGTDEVVGPALGKGGLEVGEATCLAAHGEPALTVEQRYAGRVVPSVLHTAQRVDNDAAGRTLPDVADDSAHNHPG